MDLPGKRGAILPSSFGFIPFSGLMIPGIGVGGERDDVTDNIPPELRAKIEQP
jgi:hypothetical protein